MSASIELSLGTKRFVEKDDLRVLGISVTFNILL